MCQNKKKVFYSIVQKPFFFFKPLAAVKSILKSSRSLIDFTGPVHFICSSLMLSVASALVLQLISFTDAFSSL